ncbi:MULTISPECIES: META domain-containing protein [unclassified Leptolyngbya]|uniref:META domain-containing protein n=1 Tax=unclassified Leptolyngbya TaxID=2650499 RepID=UPI0016855A58|nr:MULTISPECIES: META domain-containing protein [unclassified Leptolyngbya]MBD1909661.1 META domain-containing protein [Leptolyngbya sp. FACHB-8]MBD2157562.1 META domain-containing protein [Leptolyngbya sp. FACHB-16]
MTNKWMVGLLGIGMGLGTLGPAISAVPKGFTISLSPFYNCFTREVWSPEKQAWCQQNSPVSNPVATEMEPVLVAADPALADELLNTEWLLEDLNGTGVIDRVQTTLRFEGDGDRINGSGGCNRYFSNILFNSENATATRQTVAIGAVGATEMACPPAVMDQESRFLQSLQTAQRIELDGPYLYVYSEDQEQPMRFTQTNELVDPMPISTPEPVPMDTVGPIPGLW